MAKLIWNVVNATAVSINNGVGSVPSTGERTVTPTVSTVYTLTATDSRGRSFTASTTVNPGGVSVGAPAPVSVGSPVTPTGGPAPATGSGSYGMSSPTAVINLTVTRNVALSTVMTSMNQGGGTAAFDVTLLSGVAAPGCNPSGNPTASSPGVHQFIMYGTPTTLGTFSGVYRVSRFGNYLEFTINVTVVAPSVGTSVGK